jgi:hypothetical protein
MVEAFEMIATGSAVGFSDTVTLAVVRDIALEALEKIGWPTFVPKARDAGKSGPTKASSDKCKVCDCEDADACGCEDWQQCGCNDCG